jgi:hypothetical protein
VEITLYSFNPFLTALTLLGMRLIRNVERAVRSVLGRNIGEEAGQSIYRAALELKNINVQITSVSELFVKSPELLQAALTLSDAIQNARVQVGLDEETVALMNKALEEVGPVQTAARTIAASWENGLKSLGADAAGMLLHCAILTHDLMSTSIAVALCGFAMWCFMNAFRNEFADRILYSLGGLYFVVIMLKLHFFPNFQAAAVQALLEGLKDNSNREDEPFMEQPRTPAPPAAGAAAAAAAIGEAPPGTIMLREVFRLRTGAFTTSTQTFTSFTGATATVNLPHVPIHWHLQMNGHFVDSAAKTMRFRIMLHDNTTGAHFFFPREDGMIKYMYTDHSRLESCFFHGVHAQLIPAGDYDVQVQVACGTEGGPYHWDGVYGEVVMLMTTAE